MTDEPWVDPETKGTLVDPWLAAYEADDNTFWRTEPGHIMNVVDELIVRLSFRDQQLESANETISSLAKEVHALREAFTVAPGESPGWSDSTS